MNSYKIMRTNCCWIKQTASILRFVGLWLFLPGEDGLLNKSEIMPPNKVVDEERAGESESITLRFPAQLCWGSHRSLVCFLCVHRLRSHLICEPGKHSGPAGFCECSSVFSMTDPVQDYYENQPQAFFWKNVELTFMYLCLKTWQS